MERKEISELVGRVIKLTTGIVYRGRRQRELERNRANAWARHLADREQVVKDLGFVNKRGMYVQQGMEDLGRD